MSSTIHSNQQTFYNEILRPIPKSSCTYKFFTTLDHKCIDVKKTYRGTEKTVVKIFKISIKIFVLLLLNSVKLVLFITIITPLAFEAVSVYQNRKVTTGNKDLKRKAIAFVKASEAHFSLGTVQTAVAELSNQSEVMNINDPTTLHALRDTIHLCHDKATLHHNLIVTSNEWRDVVRSRSEGFIAKKEDSQAHFDANEFFEYAVTTLSDQGCLERMYINQTNARLALKEDLTVSTKVRREEALIQLEDTAVDELPEARLALKEDFTASTKVRKKEDFIQFDDNSVLKVLLEDESKTPQLKALVKGFVFCNSTVMKELLEALSEARVKEMSEAQVKEMYEARVKEEGQCLRDVFKGIYKRLFKDLITEQVRVRVEQLPEEVVKTMTENLIKELLDGLSKSQTLSEDLKKDLMAELKKDLMAELNKDLMEELLEKLSEEIMETLPEEIMEKLSMEKLPTTGSTEGVTTSG